ncbi:dipicolinate synthase subunit B [Ectobacillus antri]|jgi:dipicolinate synthase subunit B|uniref:Dipicolinate synthase subunit B n=1 Tax=Ectobacillus antri TaxID=2486280 RepID=A0ABT6H0C0_9BACI|nr:dipicolinate synthase subunit B [Ectobacillus antri]MDG4655952.1 dipicolinate synthase subunit B [Ectobacillus antri]MDG5752627.1 dipicolinate synthase subunit B [Ectobacillus antri]
MSLKGKRIGFGLTGSHCTYAEVMPFLQQLVDEGAEVRPVVSYTLQTTNTRFGDGQDWIKKIEEITGFSVIDSIVKAEPLGPTIPLDCMVIAPLTGSSMSKLANAQTDSPVLMAAKATLRNWKPVILAISTNDALGLNGVNLMRLMASRNMYFVPFGQDAPEKKPSSMVARMELLRDTVASALEGKQLQPVIVEKYKYMNE